MSVASLEYTAMGKRFCSALMVAGLTLLLGACLSDGGGNAKGDRGTGVGPGTVAISCDGSCANASSFLSVADVETVIAQAVGEAQARGVAATIAVVDRVGNVLAVFRMNGALTSVTITSGGGITGGLEEVNIIPDTLAAIAKAVTGAYLSTEGNAFSTRSASQIIQEHFNPREKDQGSGPLFGVQFSQLPCSDLSGRFAGGSADAGPKRSPLGLAADPGGLPLYKDGTPVGAIGVIADGIYSLDKDIVDFDQAVDEQIAVAGSFGFAAPVERRADRITVAGKTLRFSDALFSDLLSDPASAPPFAGLGGVGQLVAVNGYNAASVIAGTAFGQPASGIRPDTLDYPAALDAFVLVDNANTERFRPIAGTDTPGGNPANALTAAEVRQILSSALSVANRARAQIRRPTGTAARVSITVVDTNGTILGLVRGRDAPIFGTDVSVQKARTAAFLSGTGAPAAPADALRALPDTEYLDGGLAPLFTVSIGNYVSALQGFLQVPTALESSGAPVAFPDRAGGNLSRPTYPDGPSGGPPGPLSKPQGQWSVFSTGLQLDLVYNAVIHHVGFVLGAVPDVGTNCTGDTGLSGGFATVNPIPAIPNGIQIFPGSVPIYRGNQLIGGIGVSGDGVDQDDFVAFFGLHEAAQQLLSGVDNAPREIRADTLTPRGVRLRYVNCPFTPFNNSSDQDVCNGL